MQRLSLVPASGLPSYYRKKKDPTQRWDVSVFKEDALISKDMFEALIELEKRIRIAYGTFLITDLSRTWVEQEKRRNEFLEGSKAAFAANPGGSFHQAGRAIDFSTDDLKFKDVPKENWLKKLWDIAKPLGFKPIIKLPDMGMSERWHLDYPGNDWLHLYDYADDYQTDAIDYTLVAKCCILDVGKWNPAESPEKVLKMFLQSQLLRLGKYEIGAVDGIIGKKTLGMLEKLGLKDLPLENIANELSKM